MASELFEVIDGVIHWHPHKYQLRALDSRARFTAIMKGWRGGMTSWAAKWLEQEMRRCGPGNLNKSYFAISPTHRIGDKGLVPAIQTLFVTHMAYATYNKHDNTFTITPEGERALWGHSQNEPTKIVCCHASDPDSFASLTAIGGVADECGQRGFKLESWRTLRARVSTASGQIAPNNVGVGMPDNLKMGRILLGSTVYYLGWFTDQYEEWKALVQDEARALEARCRDLDLVEANDLRQEFAERLQFGMVHPETNFIRFDSTANPAFPPEEFEHLRRTCAAWFFDMRYRAIPCKPAGAIFEAWDKSRHVVKGFPIDWAHFEPHIAIDFGKRNFWAQLWAFDKERERLFLVATYHDTHHSNQERAENILKRWPAPKSCIAGQISEDDQRAELMQGGLFAQPPAYKDLWLGINNLAAAVRANKVFALRQPDPGDEWHGAPHAHQTEDGFELGGTVFADEMRAYARPVDDRGDVILDADPEDKETFHCIDAPRYLFSHLLKNQMPGMSQPRAPARSQVAPRQEPYAAGLPGVFGMGGMTPTGAARAARHGVDEGCYEPPASQFA